MDEPVQVQGPPPELEDRILPWSQVKVISGLSRTTVWRLQKTGDFPASVQVSPNRVGWWQSEILEWRRSRLPRRLPEPRARPAANAARRESPIRPPRTAPAVKAEPELPVSPGPERAARRRRKPVQCDNQTAFDF